MHALRDRSRVILLLGPAGVGKTLLLDDVLEDLGGEFSICRINQPRLSAPEVMAALGAQLGISVPDSATLGIRAEREMVTVENIASVQGLSPLIVVDDAHLMTAATTYSFCEILSQAPRVKLLLSGRPGSAFESFAQRMLPEQPPKRVALSPFDAAEVSSYLDHRISQAAGSPKELFSREAIALIQQHTGGVARLVNVLSDAALNTACQRASGTVGPTEVQIATQDARWPEAVSRDRSPPETRVGELSPEEAAATVTHLEPRKQDEEFAKLLVSHRGTHLTSVTLRPGRMSIGRAVDNEVRLDASWISRHHCRVTTVDGVSTIEDTNSVNGIQVNGHAVKRHVLKNADQVRLGENTLTYVAADLTR
jgi:general secretion pathway protein A